MVCKEDVLLWFKDLESFKRIDLLYELLNMCLPFELRFLGSCVEEIGKQTYQDLHGSALFANDLERLLKDAVFSQGILNECVRHRVLINLSLLSSRNYCVANWLFKTVLRTDWIEDYIVKGNVNDDNSQNEFLLLYVMALHHPAFTFEHKSFFAKIVQLLLEFKENQCRTSPKPTPFGYPPGFGYPTLKMCSLELQTVPVKLPSSVSCGDEILESSGLPMGPSPMAAQEFIAWTRPGFPCVAPESVPPPFPNVITAPNISPLVSQSASPIQSRSNSPHRTASIAILRQQLNQCDPLIPLQQQPPSAPSIAAAPSTITADTTLLTNNSNNFPNFIYSACSENQMNLNVQPQDDELSVITEEKLMGDIVQWPPSQKKQPPNGFRFQPSNKLQQVHHSTDHHNQRPFLIDQLQSLTLDTECTSQLPTTQHQSNSSSDSSLNRTPPETPQAKHNGTFNGQHDQSSTSPQPSASLQFNVPYTSTNYFPGLQQQRTIYPFNTQQYRAPFPFPYQTTNDTFSTYSLPYVIYSNAQYQPTTIASTRNQNCYNCGGNGHIGVDCTLQNIEDITQKKSYQLDYSDTEK